MNSSSKNCNNNSTNSNQFVQSCPTILACTGVTAPVTITTASAANITAANPLTVSTLNINNSCLDNPCTILDFDSTITAAAAADSVTLQVFKINLCNSTAPAIPVGSSWTFTAGAAETQSFNISACDCNNSMCNCKCCNDGNECYSYVVRAIAATVATGTLTINNPTIKAISTCGNICCNR